MSKNSQKKYCKRNIEVTKEIDLCLGRFQSAAYMNLVDVIKIFLLYF